MPLPQLQTGGVDVSNSLANIMQMRRARLAEEKQNALLGLQTEKLGLEREALQREADPAVVETKNALKVLQLNKERAAERDAHLKEVKESLGLAGEYFNKVDTSSPEQWDKTLELVKKDFPKIKELLNHTLLPGSAFYKKGSEKVVEFPMTEETVEKEWDGGLLKKHINRWNLTKEDTLKRDMNNLPPEMESKPVWNKRTREIELWIGVDKNKPVSKVTDYGLNPEIYTTVNPNDAKAPPRDTFSEKQKDGTYKNVVKEWTREKGWKTIPEVEAKVETFKEGDTRPFERDGQKITEEFRGGKWKQIASSPVRQESNTTRTYINGKGQMLVQRVDGGALYVRGENNVFTPATIADQVGLRNPSSSEEDMYAKLGNLWVEDKIKELEAKRGVKKSAGTGETVVSEPGKKKVVAPTARPYDAYR